MHVIRCECVWNFRAKFFYGEKNVKPEKNSIFLKKGKTIISVENLENF